MKKNFFENVKSLEELRRQYKKLAFKYHPDKGGKVEDMQAINSEYDKLYNIYKNVHEKADGTTYNTNTNTNNINDKFKDIINKIINFNCTIELCGYWLWVFNAFEYKDQLKSLGFFYCSRKKAWAWCEEQDKSNNKHKLTLEEIRKIHGSEVVKNKEEQEKQNNLKITKHYNDLVFVI